MTNPDETAPVPVDAVTPTIAPVAVSAVRTWAWVLAAGLAAGAIAWYIGEATLVPEAAYENKKEHVHVSVSDVGIRNGIISFGALGAVMGLTLGLAGGLIGRSSLRAFIAGAMGLLLAGGAAAALSWLILPVYYEHSATGELTYSLLVHCGVWTAVGAAAGLAYATGLGGWREGPRGLLGGACAALLASVIFEFGGGILLPQALTDRPISQTAESRLLARVLVTVMTSAGALLATRSTRVRKSVNDVKTATQG